MQFNLWVLPDIFFPYLSTKSPSRTWGPWQLQHFSRTSLGNLDKNEMQALCTGMPIMYLCGTLAFGGVWKATDRWDASFNKSQCVLKIGTASEHMELISVLWKFVCPSCKIELLWDSKFWEFCRNPRDKLTKPKFCPYSEYIKINKDFLLKFGTLLLDLEQVTCSLTTRYF